MSEIILQYFFSVKKFEAQSWAEYGLIFALVSVVTMVVLKTIGN